LYDKINSKSIKETKALEFFFNAITTCPENHRTSKNLAIFVAMNLTDYAFSNKIKSLIPSLKSIESECLYDSFQTELLPLSVELKSLMKKPNINYTRVSETINLIDELINSVDPF
jgi:RNAse (barnase) inhibitor barstar